MSRWTVGKDGTGWTVLGPDEERVRERWVGLSCIDAQVIAAELNAAWQQGILEGANAYRRTLALEALGD